MDSINWLAVLTGTIINMIVGSYWYSNAGFGKRWTRLLGKSDADMAAMKEKIQKEGGMGKMYFITFLGSLVMAYVLGNLIYAMGATTISQGAAIGAWVWLGFIATAFLNLVIFENRPRQLYWINVGYYLVVLMLEGAVFAVWR